MAILLASNGPEGIRAFAGSNLLERAEKARSLYSEEEMYLLEKRAREIKENNEGVFPISVERILSESLNFKFDTPPVIKEGRTLVPARTISEAFEASIEWDPAERKVVVRKDDKDISIWIGERRVRVDGEDKEIDVAAIILNGRTMVPLRFITENLGLTVLYHEENGIVEIIR